MSISSFFGLSMMSGALGAQKRGLEVTGHNISNANTPGFSRQRAVLGAGMPLPIPSLNRPSMVGMVGTGVQVEEIRRYRDDFLDLRFRNENREMGYWMAKADTLNKLEYILNEPSEEGLQAVMDRFWDSCQDLAQDPSNRSNRIAVIEHGVTITESFRHLAKSFDDLERELNNEVGIKVNRINDVAEKIRDINMQIQRAEVAGDNANDLRDRRDHLLDELSDYVDVAVYEQDDGTVLVRSGNGVLVEGIYVNKLTTVEKPDDEGKALKEITWESGRDAVFYGGSLRGTLVSRGTLEKSYFPEINGHEKNGNGSYGNGSNGEAGNGEENGGTVEAAAKPLQRYGTIADLRKNLAAMAEAFVTEFNNIHSHEDARNLKDINLTDDERRQLLFFVNRDDPTNGEIKWDNLTVNREIRLDPALFAAARVSGAEEFAEGDNKNVLEMVRLRYEAVDLGKYGKATLDNHYRSIISQLGVMSEQSMRMSENQIRLVTAIDNQRQSISGVSLDEEMANMIQQQHAYNAAARMLTTMDDMIDTIVSRMGLVGR
ncbi:flagellar hook-associated protein FlgK [Heliorestis convoluta]|uniref:Flagellar hook-associated protein 1 n=1 Tax=Heliorestis convoluta TaxID=356322 RepID=A0A5Q2N2I7_9FIRM|nr:flagellar hook-associated protein FlgK [Heliorestis convoluta]QGG47482.1 flagellar hook-associated protein FlgK [Heliorestis convoluta]